MTDPRLTPSMQFKSFEAKAAANTIIHRLLRKGWKLRYFRNDLGQGEHSLSRTSVITVIYRQFPDDGVSFAASYCSPVDNFCKQVGRYLATQSKIESVRFNKQFTPKELEEVVRQLVQAPVVDNFPIQELG